MAAVLIGLGIPLLASSRTAAGIALGLALIALLVQPDRRQAAASLGRALKTPLAIAAGAVFLLWLVSVAGSLDPLRSLTVWGRTAAFLVGAALIHGFLRQAPELHRMALKSLVAASLACAAVSLVGVYLFPPLSALFHGKGYVDLDARLLLKGYGSAVACLVPIVLWAGLRLKRGWRAAGLAYFPLGLALISAVHSRAGLFGLAVGLGAGLAALALRRGRGLTVFLASMCVFALAGVALALVQIPPLPAPAEIGPSPVIEYPDLAWPAGLLDAHRQVIWGFARDRALEAPWFGHGIDVSNYLRGASIVIPEFNQEFIPGHPHNWLLEVFLETGAVGLVALLGALALLLRRLALAARAPSAPGAAGVALFAAFWGSSLFNFSFWSAWWQVAFLVLTALVLAGAHRAPESGGPITLPRLGRGKAPCRVRWAGGTSPRRPGR